MKTFISALIILALLCTSVALVSHFISKRTHELSSLATSLPSSSEAFQSDRELSQKTEKLRTLWARSMAVFPYIMSYDILDRADDAVLSLSAAAETESEEDFLAARLRFIDAVSRISGLFTLSFESIA